MCAGSGQPSKATPKVQTIVDEEIHKDDKVTALQPHKTLTDKGMRFFRKVMSESIYKSL